MSNRIKHSGVIESISDRSVRVRILQTSACAQCKIAGHCNSSESKEKLVDVYNVSDTSHLKVGDSVMVTASARVAASALLIGFGLPFIVLVAVILAVYVITADEALAGLCGLGALIPYYILVWMSREKLRVRMAFEIECNSMERMKVQNKV
ncbi:MAG: SoxR reducing system RseC family protein [Prevotella sp.]|nr:SoxR reducing system RseC family protein [Prevotella sp.]